MRTQNADGSLNLWNLVWMAIVAVPVTNGLTASYGLPIFVIWDLFDLLTHR